MKSNVITIMKKELARFFSNKTSAAVSILLPGILLYGMWSLMGSALEDVVAGDEDGGIRVAAVAFPDSLREAAGSANMEITDLEESSSGLSPKERFDPAQFDILVVFPSDFEQAVASYETTSGSLAPQVEIFYDSTETSSVTAFSTLSALLDSYESALANRFDVNAGDQDYDVSDVKSRSAQFMVSILPMIILIFLFSGCMALAAESIAGEKERGTMATLLASPIKRSDIALGKILALALIGLLVAASSMVGMFASLPNLSQGAIDVNIYGLTEYALLALVVLSTALVVVMLIAVVSALAKTTKEAQLYLTPVMIVVMVIGLLGMFGDGAKTELYFYLIPLYNSVQCMIGIFTFDFQPVNMIVCVVSNVVYTGIGIFVLQNMFKSEKLMFAR